MFLSIATPCRLCKLGADHLPATGSTRNVCVWDHCLKPHIDKPISLHHAGKMQGDFIDEYLFLRHIDKAFCQSQPNF